VRFLRCNLLAQLERLIHPVKTSRQTIRELADLVAQSCERCEVGILAARLRMDRGRGRF